MKIFGRLCIDLGLLLVGITKLWLPILLIVCGITIRLLHDEFFID